MISIISVPVYIRYIGVANYGIIGIYNSLAGLAAIFDIAFSNTINRELARRDSTQISSEETGSTFRTLEIFAWLIALILAALVIFGASEFVGGWIGADKYPRSNIVGTIRLMGLLILLQAPLSFYSGCLYGMHRHTLNNGINVGGTILSTLLAVGTVVAISPTIDAFFLAQFVGRGVLLVGMAIASYALLTRDVPWKSFRVSLSTWKRLSRFALGMNGIGVLSLVSNQADMAILSRLLSATAFGSYTIARTVSQSLIALAMPAYQSAFPQLSKLRDSDTTAFTLAFHRFCRYLSMVLIPPGVVICIYSKEVLSFWTHNQTLAEDSFLTLSLLSAGSTVYGLSCMISAVQMAKGAVRSMMLLGMLFVGLLVPSLILLVHLFDQTGAALAWLAVNFVVLFVSSTTTIRRYLGATALRTWLGHDILLPILVSAAPAVMLSVFIAGPAGSASAAVAMLLSAALAVVLSALVLPEVRNATVATVASILALKRRDGRS